MKISTLYFNYVPEILLIIVTYFFSIQNEDKIALIIISVFTFLLFINFILMCANYEVNSNCGNINCNGGVMVALF